MFSSVPYLPSAVTWCGLRRYRKQVCHRRSSMGRFSLSDLDLDEIRFFSLSKDEQFESLVEFLRRASNGAAPELGRGNDTN